MTPLAMVMAMRFLVAGEKKTMYQLAERASASMGPSVVWANRTTATSGCHECARLSAAANAVPKSTVFCGLIFSALHASVVAWARATPCEQSANETDAIAATKTCVQSRGSAGIAW